VNAVTAVLNRLMAKIFQAAGGDESLSCSDTTLDTLERYCRLLKIESRLVCPELKECSSEGIVLAR